MEPGLLTESWEILRSLLPANLEEVARQTGLVRRLRGFTSVEALTRMLLMHGSGLSLEQTALRASEQRLGRTSAVALHERLKLAGGYFEQLCRHVQSGLRLQMEERRWPEGWKYRIIDATDVSEPGATGSCWRVHYSLRLPELSCDHFELTDYHQGESFKHWKIAADEVVLADRAYSHRETLGQLIDAGAHFVVRLNTGLFALERKDGTPVDLLELLAALRVGKSAAWDLWFRRGKRRQRIRVCALRKSSVAADKSRRKARRRAQQEGCKVQDRTLQLAEYVLVLTNLRGDAWDPATLLELYRCRWQVELAFKRLKSLLQLGHLPKKDPGTARAWMQMKLLIALLIERLLFDAKFIFPWGYNWREVEPVEGISGTV
jgi:hypothetical protein